MAQQIERYSFLKAWLRDRQECLDDGWYNILPLWIGFFLAEGLSLCFRGHKML